MGFFRKHWRAIATGVCLWVAIPVVGEIFIEAARKRGFYHSTDEALGKAMNALLVIADFPGFRVVVLLFIGLVSGVWLDTLVRQYAQRIRSSKEWLPLGEAIASFGDAKLREALASAQQDAQQTQQDLIAVDKEISFLNFAATYEQGQLDFTEFAKKTAMLDESRRAIELRITTTENAVFAARRAIEESFLKRLADGELVGKGMLTIASGLDSEKEIPAAFWRVFNIDVNDSKTQTVGGSGMRYTGVRIAYA